MQEKQKSSFLKFWI